MLGGAWWHPGSCAAWCCNSGSVGSVKPKLGSGFRLGTAVAQQKYIKGLGFTV